MNKLNILKLATVFVGALAIVGCSSNPIPLGGGNEMTYQSGDRPDWAGKGFHIEDGYVYATGISTRMPTERSSKESAMSNAMANLASGIKSRGTKDNIETQTVTQEKATAAAKVKNSGSFTSKFSANEMIERPSVEDSYFEIWENEKKKEQFFKYYVLIKAKI